MDITFTPVEVTTKVVTQAVVTFMASNLFISFLALVISWTSATACYLYQFQSGDVRFHKIGSSFFTVMKATDEESSIT